MSIQQEEAQYFYTEHRYNQWQKMRHSEQMTLDHADGRKFGTMGAVALDTHGNLAATTSTGRLTNKKTGQLADIND